MEDHRAMTAGELDASGRPMKSLPTSQLIRLSLYWMGLTSIFSGLTVILQGRLVFSGLVPKLEVGSALFLTQVGGAVIAMIVQPTVGTISDYTISRWGRRKPYILIGSVLDVLFLYGIATSNTVLGIAAFMVLLQFSSNFAQGPFQGYVPDLVPAQQVGLASALVGLFNVLGNVAGFLIGSAAVVFSKSNPDAFLWGTMALGILELTTMLSVVIRVDEGRTPRPRGGRSWPTGRTSGSGWPGTSGCRTSRRWPRRPWRWWTSTRGGGSARSCWGCWPPRRWWRGSPPSAPTSWRTTRP